MNRFLFILLFLFCAVPLCGAAEESAYQAHTRVQLVVDRDQVLPNGEFQAGILFEMDPGWHVYWKNPGDSGLAPNIKWQLADGIFVGNFQWPIPERISLPPLMSYGYEEKVLLAAPFKTSSDFDAQNFTLRAQVDWLACEVECIPGSAELEIAVPLKAQAELFEATQARYPLRQTPWKVSAWRFEKEIKITLASETPEELPKTLYFFPENDQLIQHAAEQTVQIKRNELDLSVALAVTQPKKLERLRGILIADEGRQGWQIDIPFEAEKAELPPPLSLWGAVLFAFLGGLILNLMPCVLPVLSLKILNFVHEAERQRKELWKHGVIFTGGVLVSFWVLAGLLIAFQATGMKLGWGFQLQSPWFVLVLAAVFFVLALSLFGFFEIGLGLTGAGQNLTGRSGWQGTFASGVLAVVVATPCTAPFMGAALGYALTQPPAVAWAVFTALGMGLAFPYFILCLNPGWMKWIPKPGPWMLRLKKIFGFLLLLTALWLTWIFTVQTGVITKIIGQDRADSPIAWETYSEERLNELRAEGKPVFVDFTAAWCLTCQVNEKLVLERAEIVELFRSKKITALKADWTNRDESITRALAAHGRNSIPFYLFYPAGRENPVILPEILTPSVVRKALEVPDWQTD